jgi:hypothetical protein
MDPAEFLESLCRRNGLAPRQAEPLLPLVQLAWTARPALRRRILELVEAALAARAPAEGPHRPAPTDLEGEEADRRLLELIAAMLHRWGPRTA